MSRCRKEYDVEVNTVKTQKQQYVTIKGTKNGLTLHLDDTCSFEELLYGLQDMLSLEHYMDGKGQKINVLVKARPPLCDRGARTDPDRCDH